MKKKLFFVAIGIVACALIFVYKFNWREKISEKVGEIYQAVENKSDEKISVIVAPGEMANFIFDFANEQSFFEKQSVTVDKMAATNNSVETFLTTGTNVYIGGISSIVAAYLGGQELRILADVAKISRVYGVSRYSKEEVGQIRRVGINSDTAQSREIARFVLKSIGSSFDSIEYIVMDDESIRESALSDNKVDLIITQSYQFLNAIDARDKYTVFDVLLESDNYPYDKFIVTNKTVLEQKTKQLQRFITGYHQALDQLKNNPVAAQEYIQKKYSYTPEQSKEFYDSFLATQQGVNFVPSKELVTSIAADVKEELKLGMERDLSGLIYSDMAQKALAGK